MTDKHDHSLKPGSTWTWAQFAAAEPELASFARQRLEGRIAYLATIRPDGSPRVHPVSPFIGSDRLFVYMEPTSPKGNDLRRDARYAMHCGVEDNSGGLGELYMRGRAREIQDGSTRQEAFEQAEKMGYSPQERYVLFELRIEEVMSTIYEQGQVRRSRVKAS